MNKNLKVLGGYAKVIRSDFRCIINNMVGTDVYVKLSYTDKESRILLVDKLKSMGYRDLNEYQTEKDVMQKYFVVNAFEEGNNEK